MELSLIIFVTAVFLFGMVIGVETCKCHINTLKKKNK